MPMCQSPKIADALLRARKFPANDNSAPAATGIKPFGPEGILRAACRTFHHRVRVHLGQLTSFAMSRAHVTQHKKQEFPAA
jgi:hypothetical protein